MSTKEVEIRFVTSWPEDEIVTLYKAGGWWQDTWDPAGVQRIIAASYAFAVVVEPATHKAIGMGRIISDGVSDAYIQDLVILSDYQGAGIGRTLVKSLVAYCHSRGINWIGLVAEPGSMQFYTHLGFKPMKDHIPMLFYGEDQNDSTR